MHCEVLQHVEYFGAVAARLRLTGRILEERLQQERHTLSWQLLHVHQGIQAHNYGGHDIVMIAQAIRVEGR